MFRVTRFRAGVVGLIIHAEIGVGDCVRLALEESLDVFVVVELVVTEWCLG